MAKKLGEADDDEDDDIDAILEKYAKEQLEFTEIKIEICDHHPTKRLNPTMVSNPLHNKRELILFGGKILMVVIVNFIMIYILILLIMILGGKFQVKILRYQDLHMPCVLILLG